MNALLTDLYQLTMAAGYFEAGKTAERATFELFVRRLPYNRNFFLAAGITQALDYLVNLRFQREEVEWLRHQPMFQRVRPEFFDALLEFRFTGDVFAVREGTPIFPNEPILTVRAPLMEAQIPETYLLATIGFQTSIATKAARIVETAGGRAVVEFGTRRAHTAQAGLYAGRAAYIGGCVGTSNVECAYRFGIPMFGTAAHAWIMSFASEREAFLQLQKLLGEGTVYLIDTYDSIEGARLAASLGQPMWGVRLDSGDLIELSRKVRRLLDEAGFPEARIMATGDLNEYRILEITAAGAPIDVFGVGTDLATSADAPSMGAVYKMVEVDDGHEKRFTAKLSAEKHTRPGAKQVFRYADHDVVGCSWECLGRGDDATPVEALLRPVMLNGELVEPLPDAHSAKAYAAEALRRLPKATRSLYAAEDNPWRVQYSAELTRLDEQVRKSLVSGVAGGHA
jgi:nicotinate phosphoribosyltransferase